MGSQVQEAEAAVLGLIHAEMRRRGRNACSNIADAQGKTQLVI
jgi:hypothetical protein